MFNNQWKFVVTAAILAMLQPQAGNTQFFPQYNAPHPGSVSRASSTASESQLGLGTLGLSRGVVNAQTQSESEGGYDNGGTTSIANSRARTHGVNLGGLNIGSTLTSSRTQTNGAVSRGLSHDFNVGDLGIGSSLSRDNLNNGLGLHHSQQGGLQLGLGLLNVDLSRKQQQREQQQQQSHASTQAQAEAQGPDAYATSNSNADTQSRQLGLLGFSRTQSQSDALSASRYGQTSATAGGSTNSFGGSRTHFYDSVPRSFLRAKRTAQFIPFLYSDSEYDQLRRHFGSRPYRQNSNAQAFASDEDEDFEQEDGGTGQSNREINENSVFENKDASSIGSNLATDGNSGRLMSSNVHQGKSFTHDDSLSTNDDESQALNFAENQEQAGNAHVGTKNRYGAQGGSEATNSNEHDTSSSIANTNSAAHKDVETSGSQADSSALSSVQSNSGENSVVQTNSHVNSAQDPEGFVSNTTDNNGNSGATASASSGVKGDHANGHAASFRDFRGGQLINTAFGNIGAAHGFTNGHSRFRG